MGKNINSYLTLSVWGDKTFTPSTKRLAKILKHNVGIKKVKFFKNSPKIVQKNEEDIPSIELIVGHRNKNTLNKIWGTIYDWLRKPNNAIPDAYKTNFHITTPIDGNLKALERNGSKLQKLA